MDNQENETEDSVELPEGYPDLPDDYRPRTNLGVILMKAGKTKRTRLPPLDKELVLEMIFAQRVCARLKNYSSPQSAVEDAIFDLQGVVLALKEQNVLVFKDK